MMIVGGMMTSSALTASNRQLKNENWCRIFRSELCINQYETQHGDECTTLCALLEQFFFKLADPYGEQATFLSSKSSYTYGEFNFGQKRKAHVHLIGVSMCQIKSSQTFAVEHCPVQKLHSSRLLPVLPHSLGTRLAPKQFAIDISCNQILGYCTLQRLNYHQREWISRFQCQL